MRPLALLAFFAACALVAAPASAQQKIGFIDSDAILRAMPEYQTARDQVNRAAAEWQAELNGLRQEVDALVQEFEARELLYTEEDRERAQQEIDNRRLEADQLRRRYFGPEGELFRQEQQLLRPIQERVLEAVETVAEDEDYDYVFDRGGDLLFFYARDTHNLTDLVLVELDIDPSRVTGR